MSSDSSRSSEARVPGLRQIVGLRNNLIHGYARVDNEQIWESVDELPDRRRAVRALLDELDSGRA